MSKQFKAWETQSSGSKIQIEVKEIAQPTTTKNTASQLSADGDGGDLSDE